MSESSAGGNLFTDGRMAEILAALPILSIPPASSHLCPKRVVIIGGSIGGLAAAACLKQTGFSKVQIVEKAQEEKRIGAGIGLDDASVGILKGLGLQLMDSSGGDRPENGIVVQRMRLTEERMMGEESKLLDRQPYPYSAVRYSELIQGLEAAAKEGNNIQRGTKAVKIEDVEQENGNPFARVHLEDVSTGEITTIDCDLVVVADGPRSSFRARMDPTTQEDDLRFAGYTAWRGTILETNLPSHVQSLLRRDYPHFSNCLYFLWGPPGKSAVLYDIGNGCVNWLVYECCDQPKAPSGRTTTTATPEDIAILKQNAQTEWGPALGSVIECTPEPFQNDIYDIKTPLTSFANGNTTCLLGDAAHPITPHAAKGSNLALQDAYELACAAQQAESVEELLERYSQNRVTDCRHTVLLSRQLGRLRNGMPPLGVCNTLHYQERPHNTDIVEALGGIPTVTLPSGPVFAPTWASMEQHIPESKRGFWLKRATATTTRNDKKNDATTDNSLQIVEVNHISLETKQVGRLVSFYRNVLGLSALPRPDFGFGGAWLQLPRGQALHIIESDPEKPHDQDSATLVPERFIRRSRHVALTVLDIEAAQSTLKAHGIAFAVNHVPDTAIVQLFFYDPDGNGIEIGNLNA